MSILMSNSKNICVVSVTGIVIVIVTIIICIPASFSPVVKACRDGIGGVRAGIVACAG